MEDADSAYQQAGENGEALIARGRLRFNKEAYEEAIAFFERAKELTDTVEVKLWLGRVYRLSGHPELGEKALESVMVNADRSDLWLEWARINRLLERREEASAAYARADALGIPEGEMWAAYSEWAELSEQKGDDVTLVKALTWRIDRLITAHGNEDAELHKLYLQRAATYGRLGQADMAEVDRDFAASVQSDEDENNEEV